MNYDNQTALSYAAREYCRTRPNLLRPLLERIARKFRQRQP